MKIFFGEWWLYIYLRPSLAITININTQSLYHIITSFVSIQLQLVAGSKSDTTDIFGLVCPVCGNQSQACREETVTNEVFSVVLSSLCTMPTTSSGNMLTTGCLLLLLCAEKLAKTLLIWQPWAIFRKQNLENVKSLWCNCTLQSYGEPFQYQPDVRISHHTF